MAFIRFTNHTCKIVSAEQGSEIWRVMQGEIPGTPEQLQFISKISRIYLNPKNAPSSYTPLFANKRRTHDVPQVALPYKD